MYLSVQGYIGLMPREKGGFRLDLGEPWASDLTDFCAANYGGSKTEIIREALQEHIQSRLANEPVLKARFDRERKKRLGLA